ncbi:MAG: hypothetical protein IIC73_06125, partial [Armatimonadetes bacterium]|nr:hypothetical protein [Armatimonadota bacterium]
MDDRQENSVLYLTNGLTALTLAYNAFSGVPADRSALDWSDIGFLSGGRAPLFASFAPELEPRKHRVLKDETDWTISRKYGITVPQLHAV